jgi:glycolate oxidase FAD binding subunit
MHDLVTGWSEQIRAAMTERRPLSIRGGGSKDFYGEPCHGALLDTTDYRGIIDYEPTELVISARSGTPLREIEAALAVERQMLAFEPPHFGSATLGGCVSSGLSGPRRAHAGAVRDFVLGVRIIDGKGDALSFGGKVIKNVAGYDVSRLITGAMGTLGLILDVSLKVSPLPETERTVRVPMPQDEAIRRMNYWAARPLPISASCYADGMVSVRLSGSDTGITSAAAQIGGQEVDEAQVFWRALREQQLDFFSHPEPLWRLSIRSTTPPLPLPGAQLLEWNGALRWVKTEADANIVRDIARKAGGHATLFRAGDSHAARFHPLPASLAQLHRRLKLTFDPAGILNPGRLYREF